MDAKNQRLRDAILQVRDCGEVTCAVETRPLFAGNVTALLDEFVAQYGFVGLGEGWREISFQSAKEIASEVIFRDLAYGVKMTTPEHAGALAEQFGSNFRFEPRFFTNALFVNGQLRSWSGISGATFDTGIVAVDNLNIGILWVQDED